MREERGKKSAHALQIFTPHYGFSAPYVCRAVNAAQRGTRAGACLGMAHTAFTVVDVLPAIDEKITSLTYHGRSGETNRILRRGHPRSCRSARQRTPSMSVRQVAASCHSA